MAKQKDNTMPVLAHILGIIVGFLGPLIILLASEDKYAKDHAKEALNWQLSLLIYIAISIPLIFLFIGIFLIIALSIMNITFGVIASVKASEGKLWKYPLAIRFFNTTA